jgi:hypothetical protein
MFRAFALMLTVTAQLAVAAAPSVPTSVRSVASAGHWEANGRTGVYRVVITNDGWEHTWSHLFIEWVASPSAREGESTVVAVVEPTLPFPAGTTILDATLRARAPGRLEVVVLGTPNGAGLSSAKAQLTLEAKAPGVVIVGAPHEKK